MVFHNLSFQEYQDTCECCVGVVEKNERYGAGRMRTGTGSGPTRPSASSIRRLDFLHIIFTMGWTSKLSESLFSWVKWPSRTTTRHVLIGVLIGFSFSITSTSLAVYYHQRKKERQIKQFAPRPIELRSDEIVNGVPGLIGINSYLQFFLNNSHATSRKHAIG
jgi:hypothetical protein